MKGINTHVGWRDFPSCQCKLENLATLFLQAVCLTTVSCLFLWDTCWMAIHYSYSCNPRCNQQNYQWENFSSRPLFNNGAGTLSVKVRKFLITPPLRPNMWQLSPKMFIFLVDGYFARKYRWWRIHHTRRPFPGIQQIVAVSWIRPYLLRECSILTTKWLYCSQLSEAKTAWKKEWVICLIFRQNESDFISESLTYPFSLYIDFASTSCLCEQILEYSLHTMPFFCLANQQLQYFTS